MPAAGATGVASNPKANTIDAVSTASKPIDYAGFAQSLNAYSVNADVTFVDEEFVLDAKRRGLKIFVYTVDQQADLTKLANWHVDGVFSNGPGRAKAFLAR